MAIQLAQLECINRKSNRALLLDYVLTQRKKQGYLPINRAVVKTIVTSEMGTAIADQYGMETYDTLTGFKYIAEKINEWTKTKEKQFLFGYEESSGFLIGDFSRDRMQSKRVCLSQKWALITREKDLLCMRFCKHFIKKLATFEKMLYP